MEGNINIAVATIIMASGFIGMYAHWRILLRRGSVTGTFIDYMLSDNPTRSGVTVGAFTSAMGLLYAAGTFDNLQIDAFVEALKNGYLYTPMVSGIVVAFTTGYFCDSTINKSDK